MAAPKTMQPASLANIGKAGRRQIRINHLSYAKLLKALTREPCSYDDLVEYTGLNEGSIRNIIRALIKEELVRICHWLPNARGVHCIMVFEFAPGKRGIPMPRLTGAERAKRYRDSRAVKLLTSGIRQPLQGASA